jgi:hypothetical protein
MADAGLSSFVAGLAGATRIPQVSNDAFYNQIIQNKLNDKRLTEARAYQEQQTEKAMKYQKELLGEKLSLEKESRREAMLDEWVRANKPLVNREDKKSVEMYNKNYEEAKKEIWSKHGRIEYMPKEEKPKKKGIGIVPTALKALFGEDYDTAPAQRFASEVGGGVKRAGDIVGESIKEQGLFGAPTAILDKAIDPYVQAYQDMVAMPVQKGMDKSSALIKQLLESGK